MADVTPPARSRRLPAAVWLFGLTSLFTDIGSELIFPLLPGFLATLGGTTLVGLVEGFADAAAALLKLPAGTLSDRLPRRLPLVLVGYGLAGLVRPLMAFATAPWHALAVRVTDRVGKGIRSAPRDALIAEVTPAGEEGRAFGVHRAMDHAGAVIGPLIATALVAAGLLVTEIFLVAAIPGLIAFVILFFVREPPRKRPTPTATAGVSSPLPGRLRSFIVAMTVFALAGSTDAFLLIRAQELGTDTALLPLLWALLNLVKLGSSWYFGALADRVSRTALIGTGIALYAVAYGALGLAGSAAVAWAIILPYGTWYGLCEPAEKALVRTLAPAGAHGRAFGWYHGALGVAAIPAGLMTGLLWSEAGPRAALWTSAGIALVALGLLLAWSRADARAAT